MKPRPPKPARRSSRPHGAANLWSRPPLSFEPLEDRWEPAGGAAFLPDLSASAGLLFVTDGDVNNSSTPGLASWTKGTVVGVGNPDLAVEPGVSGGTFSAVFNVARFTSSDTKVDALHYVRSAVTVGTGGASFALLPGDLLLSLDKTATLTGANTLGVVKDDVFVFRPTAAGDYSAGRFYPLLNNFKAVTGGSDTTGIAVVATATTVGDVTLPAGAFLYTGTGGSLEKKVGLFVPTGVGAGTTAGTSAVLLVGADIGIKSKIDGLDLITATTSIGGRTLAAGTLLFAVDGNDPIGTTSLRPERSDVVALSLSKTTLGGGKAVGTALLLFQGSDVGLDSGSEAIRALSLVGSPAAVAAADDAYAATEDTPLTVPAAAGVLANDTGSGRRTATVASGPAHGTLALAADGGFGYTPDANYFGPDRFTYTLTDGSGATRTAVVELAVAAVNDAPSFALVGTPPAVDENAGPQTVAGFAGGIDPGPDEAGQVLAFRVTGNTNPGLFAVAPAVAADGTLTYTPAADASGEAILTVVLQDDGGTTNGGQNTSTARSFRIAVRPVNSSPTLDAVADVSLPEDATRTVSLTGVTAGGGESQRLRITATSSNPAVLPDPTVSYVSPAATGTLTLAPAADANGTATVVVTVRDAGPNGYLGDNDDAETVRQFVVTVTPVQDPPVARPDTYSTNGLIQLIVAGTGVLANDTDPDGDALTAALCTGPSHGILLLQPDGTFTYTSVALYTGTDSFTYDAIDSAGNRTTGTVVINVGLGNRPPVAADDAFYTYEDRGGFEDVLANDSDPDGDPLTAVVDVGPTHGTFDFRPDGTFEYRPFADFSGTDSFTYTVYDGHGGTASATATLTVRPVNDTPAAADDTARVAEGGTATIDVLANDADIEGDSLTITAVTRPRNGSVTTDGATVTYTPDADFSGTDAFYYAVSDGNGGIATARVTVTVTATNSLPTLDPVADVTLSENGRPRLLFVTGISAGPGDRQTLTVTAVSSDPAVVADPTVYYTSPYTFGALLVAPRPDASGTAVITVTVSDGVSQVVQAFTVTVVPTNAGPTITPIADVTVVNGQAVGPLSFTVGDAETPADALTVTATSRNPGLVPAANITVTPTGGGGRQITLTPTPGATGAAVIVVMVSDGVATRSTTFVVRVTAAGHPPTAADDAFSTAYGTPLEVPAPGLLGNDADEDGDLLNVILTGRPDHGRVRLNRDGSFTYTPDAGFFGTDTFTYRAVDVTGAASAPAVVTVRVLAPPAPTAAADGYTVASGFLAVPRRSGVLANDTGEGNLRATLVSQPAHGRVFLHRKGGFVYVADAGFSGTDTFTYRAVDSNGVPSAATIVSLRVGGGSSNEVERYTVVQGHILAVPGVDADDFTAELVTSAAHGPVVLAADGAFTYAPASDFAGTDTFTYRLTDGENVVVRTVRITVEATVTPPPVPSAPPGPPTPPPPTPSAPPVPPATPTGPTPAAPPATPTKPTPAKPTPAAEAPHDDATADVVTLIIGGPNVDTVVALPVSTAAAVASTPAAPTRETSSPAPKVYAAAVVPAAGVAGGVPAVVVAAKPASAPKEAAVEPKPAAVEPPAVPPPPVAVAPAVNSSPTPTPAPAPAVTIPPPPPDVVAATEVVSASLDKTSKELTAAADQRAEVDAVVSTAAVATAGYVLLNTRAVYWFISALLARPAVWRRFDPIDVIYSWEQENELGSPTDDSPRPDGDDSLQALVTGQAE